MLLTTPRDLREPLLVVDTHSSAPPLQLPLDDPHGLLVAGQKISLSHIATHPKEFSTFIITNEVRNGSLLKVHKTESGDEGTALELQAVAPTGGDLPCYAIVDRTAQYVLVVNVSTAVLPKPTFQTYVISSGTVQLAYSITHPPV